ncbi:MAG: molybdopterin-dependent oxidoreductase [Armatimonadota bacterium]|nr:molybdopterin-dependent oxidoreductase [Armatimonadota bacterium]MDR7444210.1 molybdopterin-dependent oxidoreductase [Armatimonadota bacterium]MDR7570580.1 molybdopterin-dependent oxidoreductase [Armatimonadota bacterium]MDR7614255.1 molybdopterin-dependent oxidoreductase [Armatimonadota bacterium]
MRAVLWGGVLGVLAFGGFRLGGLILGLPLWMREAAGVRIPVELIGERLFRWLPPVWFAYLVNALEAFGRSVLGLEHFGKILALALANLTVAGLGAVGALGLRRWIREVRSTPMAVAAATLLVWTAWMFVLLPLAGGGLLGQKAGPPELVAALGGLWSLAYAGPLVLLLRKDANAPSTGDQNPLSRRALLRRGMRFLAGLLAGSALAEWAVRLAAGAQALFARIRGLPPEITPNRAFYTVSKNFFDPDVDARRWRLEVTGLVENRLVLSLEDLKRLPSVSRPHTFACISNPVGGDLIGNAVWKGVRFRDLLERARPRPQARRVVFRCADGYHTSVPLADLLDPDAFLAYEMNGEVLPKPHGFPLRAVIPGLYGMKNPKWITEIELTDKDHLGYWESQGWSDEAVVKTLSKFTTPRNGAVLPAGPVWVGGVAYAGDRGIKAVEVSFDGGRTWQGAALKPPLGRHTWVLWALRWDARPGRYTLAVRAWDGRGFPQDPAPRPSLPEGATGYHVIRVTVR